MARIAHFASLIIAGLIKPNQKIIWVSDEDNILANPDRSNDLGTILTGFTSKYIPFDISPLMIGSTTLDEGDRFEEDFASVADLIAGALSDSVNYFKRIDDQSNKSKRVIDVKLKSKIIVNWLVEAEKKLSNIEMVFEKNENGMCILYKLEIY